MRISEMLTLGKMLWFFNKFSQLIFREIYGGKSGEFACWYWGFKCCNKKSHISLRAQKREKGEGERSEQKTKQQKAHTKKAS